MCALGGDDQGLAAGSLGTREQVAGDAAIAQHVELEPEAAAGRLLGDVLKRSAGYRAQGERNVGCLRSAGDEDVGLVAQHAVEAGRGDDEWQGRGHAEQRRRQVGLGGADQGVGDEAPAFEDLPVPGQALLVVGAPFKVGQGEGRDAAAREGAQVGNVKNTVE